MGERLNDLMREYNYSAKDICELINYKTLSTVYTWINGTSTPKIDVIIKLSNLFNCSVEYLIGRSNDASCLPPKDCPPFFIQLNSFLESKNLKYTHLRNNKIINGGLHESIFLNHATPYLDSVIKIADYFKISIDELVGRV